MRTHLRLTTGTAVTRSAITIVAAALVAVGATGCTQNTSATTHSATPSVQGGTSSNGDVPSVSIDGQPIDFSIGSAGYSARCGPNGSDPRDEFKGMAYAVQWDTIHGDPLVADPDTRGVDLFLANPDDTAAEIMVTVGDTRYSNPLDPQTPLPPLVHSGDHYTYEGPLTSPSDDEHPHTVKLSVKCENHSA